MRAPGAPPRSREIDDAALTTLHGFAQRLLAEYPLEAGLPPVFEVLDDIRARVRFEQRWGELVDRIFADDALEQVLLTGLILGLRFDHLRNAARMLHDNHDRVGAPDPMIPLPRLDIEPLLAALDELVAMRSECRVEGDLLAAHIEDTVMPWRDLLRAANDDLDRLELLAAVPKLTCSNGKGASWSRPIDDVRAACARAAAACDAIVTGQRRAVLGTLIHHVVEFVVADAAARRATAPSSSTICSSSRATSSATTPASAPPPRRGGAACCSTSSRTPTRSRSSWPCCSRWSRSTAVCRPGARRRSRRALSAWSATRSSRSTGSAAPTCASTTTPSGASASRT